MKTRKERKMAMSEEVRLVFDTIYLYGPIIGATKHGMEDWRIEASKRCRGMGYRVLSPLTGEQLLWPDGKIDVANYHRVPSEVARATYNIDKARVAKSDILLGDLRNAKRISVGSLREMFWGHDWNKLVIAVMHKRSIHAHPWIRDIVAGAVFTDMVKAYKYLGALRKEQENGVT